MIDMYLFYLISHVLHDSHIQHQKNDDGLTHHIYKINMISEFAQTANSHDTESDSVGFEPRDEQALFDEVTQIYCNTIIHESLFNE